MKRLFSALLALSLLLSLSACGPAPGPTETVNNPFTQGTTAPVSTNAPSGDLVEGPTFPDDYEVPKSSGISFYVHPEHFPGNEEEDPFCIDYYYSGGEVEVPITLNVESYEYAGIGLIAFLDGVPQPFRLNDQDDYQYMSVLYLPDGDHDYTVSLLPVTGKEGQWAELWIGVVLGPELVTTDERYLSAYETRVCGPCGRVSICFLTEPESQTVPAVENRLISQNVSYEPVSYEESVRLPEDPRPLEYYSQYSVDDEAWDDRIGPTRRKYGASAENPVTIHLNVYGVPEINYRLVFYYDNLPITLEPLEIIDYGNGEKAVIDTTVDLTGFDGYARLSAYLVPLNSHRDSDGAIEVTNAINNKCVVDCVLTSAESYEDFLAGNS